MSRVKRALVAAGLVALDVAVVIFTATPGGTRIR